MAAQQKAAKPLCGKPASGIFSGPDKYLRLQKVTVRDHISPVAEDDSLVTEGYSAISRMKETEHLILLRHNASQWFFLAKDGFQGGAAELEKFRTFIAQKIGG